MNELEFIKEKVENETSLKLETKSRDLDSTIARWLYFKIAKINTCYSLIVAKIVKRNIGLVMVRINCT